MIEKQAGGGSPDTWLYTYDQRNLLTSVVEKSNGTTVNYTLAYTYDVLGERVQQSEWTSGGSTVTTRSAYTDAQTMWATLNTSNVVQERYLWGNSLTQLLAQISVGGATLSFALTDHLGSVHDLTDGGTILDHIEYGAFGSVTSQTSVANGSNFGYTCLWYDATAGIVDAEARAYSVSTHQWMQEDPIAFGAGDASVRRYVSNNPINAIDPTGLIEFQGDGISGVKRPNSVFVIEARATVTPSGTNVTSNVEVWPDRRWFSNNDRRNRSLGIMWMAGFDADPGKYVFTVLFQCRIGAKPDVANESLECSFRDFNGQQYYYKNYLKEPISATPQFYYFYCNPFFFTRPTLCLLVVGACLLF